jgi:hypothetical protein
MRIAVSARSIAARGVRLEVLHLREFIDLWGASGDEVTLIRSGGAVVDLPGDMRALLSEPASSTLRRTLSIVWEEARDAGEAGADVLSIPEARAPLVTPLPVVALFTGREARPTSFFVRLRLWAGYAGLRGASALLRLNDLPIPPRPPDRLRLMPPFIDPSFDAATKATDAAHTRSLGLTRGYCLAFADTSEELRLLLAAWSWVTGALGDEYSDAIARGAHLKQEAVSASAEGAGVGESVRPVDGVTYDGLPALLRGADVFLHSGRTSIGQELRWALACGLPVAGVETAEAAAVVGDAGYLVPPNDARALGAACLTCIVDADVAEGLKERGLSKAGAYHAPSSRRAWSDVIHLTAASPNHRRSP